MSTNPWPEFYHLINEIHSCAEQIDYFDLNSQDSESVQEFKHLNQMQKRANVDLIMHILENRDAFLKKLAES